MASSGSDAWTRPRRAWAGPVTSVLGLALLGFAASVRSRWVTAAGTLLLVLGLSTARRGRSGHDVHSVGGVSGTTDSEPERIHRGGTEKGENPGPMIQDEKVQQHSRQTQAEHRREVHTPTPSRRLDLAGAVLMLCAAVLLLVAQYGMFPNSHLGEENATFMVAPTAVLALCGLNVVARPTQGHRLAGVFGLLAGAAILLIALLNPHQSTGTWVIELVCGGAGILGASASLPAR